MAVILIPALGLLVSCIALGFVVRRWQRKRLIREVQLALHEEGPKSFLARIEAEKKAASQKFDNMKGFGIEEQIRGWQGRSLIRRQNKLDAMLEIAEKLALEMPVEPQWYSKLLKNVDDSAISGGRRANDSE